MDKEVIIERLVSLARLDFDALCVYETVLKRLDSGDADLRANLTLYRNDHALHVNALSTAIIDLGGKVPALSPEARGCANSEMQVPDNVREAAGILEAIRRNELLVSRAYASALSSSDLTACPKDVREHLQNNYDDEEHHLSYLESALNELAVGVS